MYAELLCTSNYSFLRGASHPEELVEEAARLGHRAVAITDENTVGGVVRAHTAAKERGIKLLIGARLTPADGPQLAAYATDRAAYGRLTRLISTGRRRAPKGECMLTMQDIFDAGEGLLFLVRPPRQIDDSFIAAAGHIRDRFGDRAYLAATRDYGPGDIARLRALAAAAQDTRLPLVATNDVHYHDVHRRPLQDVLVCVREGCTIGEAGYRLFPHAERHLKSPQEMARLFRGAGPAAAAAPGRTLELADRCHFSLDELRYEYPIELAPPGVTPMRHLIDLTWRGAAVQFPGGVPEGVRRQIEHELALIDELKYEAYFLTVHDIVRFARSRDIFCQGRGSAANSAVCYCLGVTSVDPSRIGLLFERFVSRERNEPPDIDVDFEHERREEVIQYIYGKYGRERAGLTAVVTTYRRRSAIRDVGKALGLSLDLVDRLAKDTDWWDKEMLSEDQLARSGLSGGDRTLRLLVALTRTLFGFPRHRSQHVGGFVITRGPLCELVPIENAAMPDRTVIEWNKDDIDELGILKVDVLGLGMLTCIHKAFDMIEERGVRGKGTRGKGKSKLIDAAKTIDSLPQSICYQGDDDGSDSELSRFNSLAEGNDAGRGSISDDEVVSGGRAFRSDAADAPSGSVDSIKYRRRPLAAVEEELHQALADRTGIFSGARHAARIVGTPESVAGNRTDFRITNGRGENPQRTPLRSSTPVSEQVAEVEPLPLAACPLPLLRPRRLQLHTIPPEDPIVYDMICRADTIGVFQIESRGQMSMLPRLRPRNFYDLVIEVAILRPGPIQGNMVHPFLRRRNGIEPVTYPNEAIKGVLEKTLGVPLFQEQVMRLAVVAAGFTGGEADRLRRAMAAFRRQGEVEQFYRRFMEGMRANGYSEEFGEQLFDQIRGFGAYGFPESHAASFALLVYVSAWLKRYHPAAFAAALLNSQPMGFYAPAQIVRDAREHGVPILPVDVNYSEWGCTLEPPPGVSVGQKAPAGAAPAAWGRGGPALRLGLRMVKGLQEDAMRQLVAARAHRPFKTIADLARRCPLGRGVLERLARANAFGSLRLDRRAALWQILAVERAPAELPLFAMMEPREPKVRLPEMPLGQRIYYDYAMTGLSLEAHPVSLAREALRQRGRIEAAKLLDTPSGRWVRIAGLVICRQRPETASGVMFITLEDETGAANVIVRTHVYEKYRSAVLHALLLDITGRVERQGAVIHVLATKAEDFSGLMPPVTVSSRDFR